MEGVTRVRRTRVPWLNGSAREDIRSRGSNFPSRGPLVSWRDKFYAHRDPDHVLDPELIPPLTWRDVHALMNMGVRIINRYSQLSTASEHSTRMVGDDDYQVVFKAIRLELKTHEVELRRELLEIRRGAKHPRGHIPTRPPRRRR